MKTILFQNKSPNFWATQIYCDKNENVRDSRESIGQILSNEDQIENTKNLETVMVMAIVESNAN